MGDQNKYKSGSIFDMQFITSSISTTLVLLLLGLVVFFVLTAHNLSVYVRENISFSVLISDEMKEADIRKVLMGTAYWAVTYEQELLQVITPEVMLIVCASVLAFGIVITWLCAYFSMNKYLRMKANSLYYI